MQPQSREEWSKWVTKAEASGQTITEFAAVHGLSRSALYFWRRKLRRAKPAPTVSFVRLETRPEPPPRAALELLFPSGVVVRVPDGFEEAALVRLLAAMEARR